MSYEFRDITTPRRDQSEREIGHGRSDAPRLVVVVLALAATVAVVLSVGVAGAGMLDATDGDQAFTVTIVRGP